MMPNTTRHSIIQRCRVRYQIGRVASTTGSTITWSRSQSWSLGFTPVHDQWNSYPPMSATVSAITPHGSTHLISGDRGCDSVRAPDRAMSMRE